ncbi:hypothetical protein ACHAW5_003670 [Stephanodiscus triporus]|uniref:Phytase-like domain-containing protein n=1 Tax=Stephanodiscus triporus TaxID=2934178 RepID=A0ABD3NEY0_9STRA
MKVSSLAGIAICTMGVSSRSAIAQLLSNTKVVKVGVRGGEYGSGGGRRAMGEDILDRELQMSTSSTKAIAAEPKLYFTRVATFPVCKLIEQNCNTTTTTNAEIVAVTDDGMIAVFTDSQDKHVGLVDISDPRSPQGRGRFSFPGKPTGVALKANYALVCVETGTAPATPAGYLAVLDISTPAQPDLKRTMDFGGQPDSIFVSPDKKYAVAVIENRRIENGIYPQAITIPGFIAIVDISAENPEDWVQKPNVALTKLPGLRFEDDPEPEFASISDDNIAVVTLQENNAIVFINITNGKVIQSFHAGSVNLENVDLTDDKEILQNEAQDLRRREPDGVAWIGTRYIMTANEGDLDGGTRGFTIFDRENGNVMYESNASAEHLITSFGHYNDKRSKSKGVEFESVVHASDLSLAFVMSERSSVILIYDVSDPSKPKFHQVLPSGVAPEGGYYVKSKKVLVVAGEEDNRGGGVRSSLAFYTYGSNKPSYPTIQSELKNYESDVYFPWGAISGLSAPYRGRKFLYAVDDSIFKKSKIFTIDVSKSPPKITNAMYIKDTANVLANFNTADTISTGFNSTKLVLLINSDKTVNLDPEGIVAVQDGYWIAHEGGGNSPNVNSLNFLIKVNMTGVIVNVVSLPNDVNMKQKSNGFEGVTKDGNYLIVAFQREWLNETLGRVRLGLYNLVSNSWKFVCYPLDPPESQYAGGWVGLSEITGIGGGKFLLVERDNRAGPDAAIKRIYTISLGPLDKVVDGINGTCVKKTLYRDILPDVSTAIGGLALEKVEGMALLNGRVWINTDNDGTDGTSGETQLINLGQLVH